MNKKDKHLLIAIIVLSLILALEVIWVIQKNLEVKQQMSAETVDVETQVSQSNTEATVPPDVPEDSVATDLTEITDSTETSVIPNSTESVVQPTTTDAPVSTEKPKETVPNEKTEKPDTSQNKPNYSIRLPYTIPGSGLVIEQINSYDGLFLEDGSDKEVTNVTAMVLANTGDVCAEYIEITIDRDGVQLKFIASALESGGKMIVLEASGKQFSNGQYSKCVADVATLSEFTMSENQLRVEETAEGSLLVTNITGKDIPCIRIFYKFYMTDSDVYVGGITYTAKVTDLAAGASCTITPSHYLKGYSKIVMVKTYDMGA